MDRPRNNRFLESDDNSGGVLGWAVKQLAMWSFIGLIAYLAAVNHQFWRMSEPRPAATPGSAAAAPAVADAPAEQPRPLGQLAPLVINTLSLRAQSNGHVLLDAMVNGAPIRFLVDTGATYLSLTHADALKAGVGGALNYSIPMVTANGNAKAAPVTLREVRIGQLAVADVAATVMPEETGISLLGQSFLQRLRSYEMRGDMLTLSWQ